MSVFAVAVGSLFVGLCTILGTLVYVATSASRLEQRTPRYAGDHNTGVVDETAEYDHPERHNDRDTVAHAEQASQPLDG